MTTKSPDGRRPCDCYTQLILLLMREGCLEDPGLERLDFRQHLVRRRTLDQQEKCRGALGYRLPKLLDELVVDPVIRHRPRKGTKAGTGKPAHRHTRQWIKHQQPRKSTDQHAGAEAPRGTKRQQVDRLFDLDLTGLSVDHDTGILQVDKVLLLHGA